MNTKQYAGAEEIIAHTGASGVLAAAIRQRFAANGRGGEIVPAAGIEYLRDWALACGLVEPRLEWREERRGRDVLVRPVVVGAANESCEVRRARGLLVDAVDRAWGSGSRRYRAQPGGRRRLARDRRPVEQAWGIVMPIWASVVVGLIATASAEPYWYITYRWAMPYPSRVVRGNKVGTDPIYPEGIDPQMPHVSGRPVSPAARRIQLAELESVRSAVERIRPRLLAVRVSQLESHHQVNRAGYLPRIAGVDERSLPAGAYAAIEADAEIAAHADRLRRAKLAEIGVC